MRGGFKGRGVGLGDNLKEMRGFDMCQGFGDNLKRGKDSDIC